jgi:hypothetical protein
LQLACSIYLVVLLIFRAMKEHRKYMIRFILLFLSVAVGVGLLIGIRFLQSWAQS